MGWPLPVGEPVVPFHIARGERDKLVLASFSYSHSAMWVGRSARTALRDLGTDYLDVLLLGYHSGPPRQRILSALDLGPLSEDEMNRLRRIGDHVYGKKRA